MINNNPLLDNDFLVKLNEYSEREIYAKVISLDIDEYPQEEISGHVTQGSISLDGTSAIRRTCSLTLVAEDININEYYWGMHTKVQIFLGMKNFVDASYPDIIWFPQGLFILTTFSTSQNVQGYTINLQGKDKMCLLNGDIGGNITALSVDFGKIDEEVVNENGMGTGEYCTKDFLIKDIITEAVHTYASEPYSNIIVNDLDDVGLELLEYRGKTPLYLIINQETNEVRNMNLIGSTGGYYKDNKGTPSPYTLETIPEDKYDTRVNKKLETVTNPLVLYVKEDTNEYAPCTIAKVTAGEVVGYRITDLTYAGDLIGSVGQSIANSVLDPIVKQLGDFEYFYDTDGRFIFQRKKTYVNTSFSIINNDGEDTYTDAAAYTSSSMYSFENSNLITSFNNNPDLSNVKNDYSIWGSRKGVSGAEIPVHIRYAIDKKPVFYKNIEGQVFITKDYEDVGDQVLSSLLRYNKIPNPAGLEEPEQNSDGTWTKGWWVVTDWANYYKQLTGKMPTGAIEYTYALETGVFPAGFDLNEIFPEPDRTQTYSKWGARWDEEQQSWITRWNPPELFGKWPVSDTETRVLIFDVMATGELAYYGHRFFGQSNTQYRDHGFCGCSFDSYFSAEHEASGITSYVYNPTIPKDELAQIISEKMVEVDWREIIYQMALDYFKYGQRPDFLAQIAKNNYSWYPTGLTGYEQYYTDINGFWRQIYNTSLTQVEKFNYIKVYDTLDDSISPYTDKAYNSWTEDDFVYYKKKFSNLYYKREKIYISAQYWNPFLTLYIQSTENAPEHKYQTFYTIKNGKYVKHMEDEVVIPTTVYIDKDDIYYKNGSDYIPYLLYAGLPNFYEVDEGDSDEEEGESDPSGTFKGDAASSWLS